MLDDLAAAAVAALLLIWFGYPLAVAVLSSLIRQRKDESAAYLPSVTVVIASRDAVDAIRARVANALSTSYPADLLSVVVAVDRASALPDESLLQRDERVRVVPADAPGGKAAALNAALRTVSSDIVIFADTHQRFEADTIPRLAAGFRDEGVGAVSGSLRLPADARSLAARYWAFERWLRQVEARVHSSVGATGAVYAIRTRLWRPLPTNLILDDVYTPMQIVLQGYRVAFDEAAIAVETRKPSPAQEYGRKVRTLTGVVQLCAWLPAVLVPVRNPIWVQFVSHKLLRLLTPYLVAVLGVWMVVRAAAFLGAVPVSVQAAIIGGAAASALWVYRANGSVARRIRRATTEGVLLQKAVIVAGFNGMRGRWQVWDV